ncbi:FAD-binding domain-containing protein [Alternaria alternata]|uniref:FAD-binding domain-containing protein n=1 Tax=Alternaria alternata TaxID=5599 RepID=A0A177DYU8_ALTAL|nr:FAD-binding domain-containing protein [Alternaria alternata]OAG24666.1 FAD-binding domain-containing protein [Alternaria alternata]
MMHLCKIISLGFFPIGLLAQNAFEPPDFDITAALLQNGVDVSTIASLAGLSKRTTSSGGCSIACSSLKRIFGDAKVETREETAYTMAIDYFWSAQQKVAQPYCVFKPEEALDVSTMVLLSRLTQCPFAVRSGGHAAFAGASNIDGGITVLFERMKQITLSKDKKVASIGPGNLWYDIYTTLAKDNLAVVGGRVSGVGIGGLTTGGGISFFSNEYGWACDNVASYEVVTASGCIIEVSQKSYPDLYWALRGGGNNLALVTKFNLETFAHGPLMFGGQRRFLSSSFPAAIDAFVNLGTSIAKYPKAAQFLAIILDAATNTQIAIAELEYADPVAKPPVFEEYFNVQAFQDTTELNTLAYFTQQLNNSNPKGYRESFWTSSSKLDRDLVQFMFDATYEEFANIRDVAGILPANTFQIITVPQLEQMQKKGGNALGLSPSDGPILIINLSSRWDNAEDDERVLKANANIVRKMEAEAKRRNLVNDYIYMNYASQFQDVVGSYGESADKLRRIARKYDPTEVFQKLQPGYFKLQGPPNKNWP